MSWSRGSLPESAGEPQRCLFQRDFACSALYAEGDTLVVETSNLRFNDQSKFANQYDGIADDNLRVTERFTRTAADLIIYRAIRDRSDRIHQAVDHRTSLAESYGPGLRIRLPRGQLWAGRYSVGCAGRGKKGCRAEFRSSLSRLRPFHIAR